jgi:transposase
MENRTVVAVDLAKSVFEIAVSQTPGEVNRVARLSRSKFLAFFETLPPSIVVMEACGSATYWGRRIQSLGHEVVLLPPHQVRPYVTRNKTDRTDAKGILEAYRNKDIHPVPIKSVEQQVMGSLHRFRSSWIQARTAQVNTLRGLLREFGVAIPVGIEKVLPSVRLLIEDADSVLPAELRPVVVLACDEIETLTTKIKHAEREIESLGKSIPQVEQILTIPGVGVVVATAFYAFVGDVKRFASGRHLASYLGLTPRERSSGGRRRLGAISKRGDGYLRMLLVHGARSLLFHAGRAKSHDRLREWAMKLRGRTKHNKAAVAVANKLARILWAVSTHGQRYESTPPAVAA